MPDWQKEDARRTRARRSNFGGFRSGAGGEVATDEDYRLLGLARDPPPTAAASECAASHSWPNKLTAHCVSSTAVGAAFRALAMTAHPDRLQQALAVRQGSRFNLSAHITPPFPVLQGQSEVEMAKCTQRFQDLLAAHARLRRKHSNTN